MMRFLYILLFLPLFSFSQEETIMYSDTLRCYGTCLDECYDVKVYVELYEWDGDGMSLFLDRNPDSTIFDGVVNLDMKRYSCDDNGFYMKPWRNKWNITKIIVDDEGVFFRHRHNLFYRHWFIYHNR